MKEDSKIQFFGKVTASLSHEMKNAIAIINENAGLLEDYSLLAKKGVPFDEERIERMASDLQMQVDRADMIVKRLNVFAHTTDFQQVETNIAETLVLFSELFKRTASMKGIECTIGEDSKELSLITDPFLIIFAVWEIVEYIASFANGESKIKLNVSDENNENYISLLTSFSLTEEEINQAQFPFVDSPFFSRLSVLNNNDIRLFIKEHS